MPWLATVDFRDLVPHFGPAHCKIPNTARIDFVSQEAAEAPARALLRNADAEHKGNDELFFVDKKGNTGRRLVPLVWMNKAGVLIVPIPGQVSVALFSSSSLKRYAWVEICTADCSLTSRCLLSFLSSISPVLSSNLIVSRLVSAQMVLCHVTLPLFDTSLCLFSALTFLLPSFCVSIPYCCILCLKGEGASRVSSEGP